MNSNLQTSLAIFLAIGCLISMVFGFFVVFHSIHHMGTESSHVGTLEVGHIGSMSGESLLITAGLGTMMIILPIAYIFKSFKRGEKDEKPQKGKHQTKHDRLIDEPTESGKLIANLKKLSPR